MEQQQTSLYAYGIIQVKSSTMRAILYAKICAQARTCDELEQELPHWTHQSVSARINELHKSGYIKDSGERRPTRTGRQAIVWEDVKVKAW